MYLYKLNVAHCVPVEISEYSTDVMQWYL